jgi:hypothetical protein
MCYSCASTKETKIYYGKNLCENCLRLVKDTKPKVVECFKELGTYEGNHNCNHSIL